MISSARACSSGVAPFMMLDLTVVGGGVGADSGCDISAGWSEGCDGGGVVVVVGGGVVVVVVGVVVCGA